MLCKGAEKRINAMAIRCYKLRQEGYTLSEIASITGLDRDKVVSRIKLGERLASVQKPTNGSK